MLFSGLVTYNTYLEVLGKSGSWQQAEDVFRDMQKRGVLPAVNTFTIMINIYGKVSHIPTTHNLLHIEHSSLRFCSRLVIAGREKLLARHGYDRNLACLILDLMLQLDSNLSVFKCSSTRATIQTRPNIFSKVCGRHCVLLVCTPTLLS